MGERVWKKWRYWKFYVITKHLEEGSMESSIALMHQKGRSESSHTER